MMNDEDIEKQSRNGSRKYQDFDEDDSILPLRNDAIQNGRMIDPGIPPIITSDDSHDSFDQSPNREEKLICFSKKDEILKEKEVSGPTNTKLSNYLLRKQNIPKKRNITIDYFAPKKNQNSFTTKSNYKIIIPGHKTSDKNINSSNYNSNKAPTRTELTTQLNSNSNNSFTKNKKDVFISRSPEERNKTFENNPTFYMNFNFSDSFYKKGGRIDFSRGINKIDIPNLRQHHMNQIIRIQRHFLKWINSQNSKNNNIIKIQSLWRGYSLRVKLYNSIYRYYTGRAFINHINKFKSLLKKRKFNEFSNNVSKLNTIPKEKNYDYEEQSVIIECSECLKKRFRKHPDKNEIKDDIRKSKRLSEEEKKKKQILPREDDDESIEESELNMFKRVSKEEKKQLPVEDFNINENRKFKRLSQDEKLKNQQKKFKDNFLKNIQIENVESINIPSNYKAQYITKLDEYINKSTFSPDLINVQRTCFEIQKIKVHDTVEKYQTFDFKKYLDEKIKALEGIRTENMAIFQNLSEHIELKENPTIRDNITGVGTELADNDTSPIKTEKVLKKKVVKKRIPDLNTEEAIPQNHLNNDTNKVMLLDTEMKEHVKSKDYEITKEIELIHTGKEPQELKLKSKKNKTNIEPNQDYEVYYNIWHKRMDNNKIDSIDQLSFYSQPNFDSFNSINSNYELNEQEFNRHHRMLKVINKSGKKNIEDTPESIQSIDNFDKISIIKEYLNNKIESFEFAHNENFNINSTVNKMKKFDSLIEDFNFFSLCDNENKIKYKPIFQCLELDSFNLFVKSTYDKIKENLGQMKIESEMKYEITRPSVSEIYFNDVDTKLLFKLKSLNIFNESELDDLYNKIKKENFDDYTNQLTFEKTETLYIKNIINKSKELKIDLPFESLFIKNKYKPQNIPTSVININYNNFKGQFLKKLSTKIEHKTLRNSLNKFYKWKEFSLQTNNEESFNTLRAKMYKKIIGKFKYRQFYSIMKRRFISWKNNSLKIRKNLMNTICLKRIIQVIKNCNKNFVFPNLIEKLTILRDNKIKAEKLINLLRKLNVTNGLRLLSEFKNWRLQNMNLIHLNKNRSNILRSILLSLGKSEVGKIFTRWKTQLIKLANIDKLLLSKLRLFILSKGKANLMAAFNLWTLNNQKKNLNQIISKEKLKHILLRKESILKTKLSEAFNKWTTIPIKQNFDINISDQIVSDLKILKLNNLVKLNKKLDSFLGKKYLDKWRSILLKEKFNSMSRSDKIRYAMKNLNRNVKQRSYNKWRDFVDLLVMKDREVEIVENMNKNHQREISLIKSLKNHTHSKKMALYSMLYYYYINWKWKTIRNPNLIGHLYSLGKGINKINSVLRRTLVSQLILNLYRKARWVKPKRIDRTCKFFLSDSEYTEFSYSYSPPNILWKLSKPLIYYTNKWYNLNKRIEELEYVSKSIKWEIEEREQNNRSRYRLAGEVVKRTKSKNEYLITRFKHPLRYFFSKWFRVLKTEEQIVKLLNKSQAFKIRPYFQQWKKYAGLITIITTKKISNIKKIILKKPNIFKEKVIETVEKEVVEEEEELELEKQISLNSNKKIIRLKAIKKNSGLNSPMQSSKTIVSHQSPKNLKKNTSEIVKLKEKFILKKYFSKWKKHKEIFKEDKSEITNSLNQSLDSEENEENPKIVVKHPKLKLIKDYRMRLSSPNLIKLNKRKETPKSSIEYEAEGPVYPYFLKFQNPLLYYFNRWRNKTHKLIIDDELNQFSGPVPHIKRIHTSLIKIISTEIKLPRTSINTESFRHFRHSILGKINLDLCYYFNKWKNKIKRMKKLEQGRKPILDILNDLIDEDIQISSLLDNNKNINQEQKGNKLDNLTENKKYSKLSSIIKIRNRLELGKHFNIWKNYDIKKKTASEKKIIPKKFLIVKKATIKKEKEEILIESDDIESEEDNKNNQVKPKFVDRSLETEKDNNINGTKFIQKKLIKNILNKPGENKKNLISNKLFLISSKLQKLCLEKYFSRWKTLPKNVNTSKPNSKLEKLKEILRHTNNQIMKYYMKNWKPKKPFDPLRDTKLISLSSIYRRFIIGALFNIWKILSKSKIIIPPRLNDTEGFNDKNTSKKILKVKVMKKRKTSEVNVEYNDDDIISDTEDNNATDVKDEIYKSGKTENYTKKEGLMLKYIDKKVMKSIFVKWKNLMKTEAVRKKLTSSSKSMSKKIFSNSSKLQKLFLGKYFSHWKNVSKINPSLNNQFTNMKLMSILTIYKRNAESNYFYRWKSLNENKNKTIETYKENEIDTNKEMLDLNRHIEILPDNVTSETEDKRKESLLKVLDKQLIKKFFTKWINIINTKPRDESKNELKLMKLISISSIKNLINLRQYYLKWRSMIDNFNKDYEDKKKEVTLLDQKNNEILNPVELSQDKRYKHIQLLLQKRILREHLKNWNEGPIQTNNNPFTFRPISEEFDNFSKYQILKNHKKSPFAKMNLNISFFYERWKSQVEKEKECEKKKIEEIINQEEMLKYSEISKCYIDLLSKKLTYILNPVAKQTQIILVETLKETMRKMILLNIIVSRKTKDPNNILKERFLRWRSNVETDKLYEKALERNKSVRDFIIEFKERRKKDEAQKKERIMKSKLKELFVKKEEIEKKLLEVYFNKYKSNVKKLCLIEGAQVLFKQIKQFQKNRKNKNNYIRIDNNTFYTTANSNINIHTWRDILQVTHQENTEYKNNQYSTGFQNYLKHSDDIKKNNIIALGFGNQDYNYSSQDIPQNLTINTHTHRSSISLETEYVDDITIGSVIDIQHAWRNHLASRFLLKYSKWLKILHYNFYNLQERNNLILEICMIRWKRACMVNYLNGASNQIKFTVLEKVRAMREKARIANKKGLSNIFHSYLHLNIVKNVFKNFVFSYRLSKAAEKTKKAFKMMTFKHLFYYLQFKLGLQKVNRQFIGINRNFYLREYHSPASLFNKNRIAITYIKNLAASIIQRKIRSLIEKNQKSMKKLKLTRIINNILEEYLNRWSDLENKITYRYLRTWNQKTSFIRESSAIIIIYRNVLNYMMKSKLQKLIYKYTIRHLYKYFLIFAEMYNCKDRVSYITHVLSKIIKKKCFTKICFLTTIKKHMLRLNSSNILESKRDILKLWYRKMKLIRRKDHSMLKITKIIKLHAKNLLLSLLHAHRDYRLTNTSRYCRNCNKHFDYEISQEIQVCLLNKTMHS